MNTPISDSVYVCCDIVQDSIFRNTKLPILRRCAVYDNEDTIEEIFGDPYYIEISRDQIHKIRIYIKDKFLNTVLFKSNILECTLHLLKQQQ